MRHAQLFAALIAVSVACHPAQSGGATPHGDSRTITPEELAAATQLNLYDYIQSTHPRWLVSIGGAQSFPILVYMNETAIGPVDNLRTMGLASIRTVRYYDASAAQSHFNRVNMGPVIQVVPR